jgi:16S rRNA processing protein RimM
MDGARVELDRRAGRPDRPILRLAGVASREAIEALRGAPLLVARADLPPLEEDEIWAHDLEGCEVVDGARPVGAVRRLIGLPSCEVLEVERPGVAELLLVPMVRDAVRSIDVQARRVDVDLEFLGAA